MNNIRYTLLVGVIMFFTSSAIAATTVEIYGDDGYAPYSYKEGGQIKGINTRVIAEVGQRIPEYDIVLKPISWKKGLSLLEAGKIGFLYPPYYRPKQRPYMTYTDSLMTEKVVLFCRTELADKGLKTFPDDFKGLSVGVKLGYTLAGKMQKAADDGIVKIVELTETKAILNRVIKGAIDCYTNDRLSALFELKQLQEQGAYDGKSITEVATMSTEESFVGVAKNGENFPYSADFVEKFNKALEEMRVDGTLEKIINE